MFNLKYVGGGHCVKNHCFLIYYLDFTGDNEIYGKNLIQERGV